jgi:hypothetical protein
VVAYLTKLLVAQPEQYRMLEGLMNHVLGSIWKEAVVACFEESSQYYSGWTEVNHDRTQDNSILEHTVV